MAKLRYKNSLFDTSEVIGADFKEGSLGYLIIIFLRGGGKLDIFAETDEERTELKKVWKQLYDGFVDAATYNTRT